LLREQNDILQAQDEKARQDLAAMAAELQVCKRGIVGRCNSSSCALLQAGLHERDGTLDRLQHMEDVQNGHDAAVAQVCTSSMRRFLMLAINFCLQLKVAQSQLGNAVHERDSLSQQVRQAKAHKQHQDGIINQLKTEIRCLAHWRLLFLLTVTSAAL